MDISRVVVRYKSVLKYRPHVTHESVNVILIYYYIRKWLLYTFFITLLHSWLSSKKKNSDDKINLILVHTTAAY